MNIRRMIDRQLVVLTREIKRVRAVRKNCGLDHVLVHMPNLTNGKK